ncbi:MAG: T9SS type A sorting domain-containing protein [Candidatus Eisenbacteria bacterium]
MTVRVLAAALLAALATAAPAAAAPALGDSLEPFGADLFAEPLDAVLLGETAFVLYPSGLVALDVTSHLRIEETWRGYLPGEGGDLFARDTLLYVSRGSGGLFTLSVSDPANPVFLDTIRAPSSFGRMDVGWNRLYVADADSGLIVYDLQGPIPSRLYRYEAGEKIKDVVIDGGIAYLALDRSGVQLVDITFFAPSLVSEIDDMEGALHLAAAAGRLYGALPDSTIVVADVSDSTDPLPLPDRFDGGGPIGDIALLDTFLVAVREDHDLLLLRANSLGGGAIGVESGVGVIGRITPAEAGLLAMSDEAGFQFFDLILPQSATYVSNISFSGVAVSGLAVQGDTAYLSGGGSGVFLVGLQDEVALDSLGRIATTSTVNAVAVREGILYSAEAGGLRMYDVATGGLLGSLPLSGSSQQVGLIGDYAYVCGGTTGLAVIDVGDPESPALVDSIPNGGNGNRSTRDLARRGDILAIAEGGAGLRFADVSDPSHPVVVGSYDPADYVVSAAYSGAGHLYVTLRSTGVLVLDTSDPAAPDSVGILELPGALLLLNSGVLGSVLYVTENVGFGQPGNIHVVSLADPVRPALIRTLISGGSPSRVVTRGNRAYIAAGLGGMEIYGFFENYGFLRSGVFDPHPRTEIVASSEGRIVVADEEGRVWSFYLGEGEVLVRGQSLDLGSPVADLVMEGTVAFASLPDAGRIARLRVPSPGAVGLDWSAEVSGAPDGLALADSVLYAALRSGGLGLFDARNADTLVSFGAFTSGGGFNLGQSSAERVFVDSGVAYVTAFETAHSLFIFDVSDPAAPAPLSTYATPYRALDVAARSGYVYLILRIDGCHVVDARNPATPVFVIARNDFLPTTRLEIVDDVLFSTRRESGVSVFNAANAINPVLVWSEPTPTAGRDLTVFGTYLGLADRSALRVYRQGFANSDQAAPNYAVGILPNAFVNAFVDFVVVVSEALIAKPEIRFTMGDVDSLLTVYRIDTPRNVYHSTYRLGETGIGTVTVAGEDLSGNKSQTNKNFSVSFLRGSKGGSIYDETGKVSVRVAPRAGVEEEAILLIPAEEDLFAGDGSDAAHGPFRLHLGRMEGPAELTVRDLVPSEGAEAPGVYRKEGETWVPVAAVYDPAARVLRAELPGSSVFFVAAVGEASPPPAPPAVLESNRPNPFNPSTEVLFRLAEKGRARVAVYDLTGRLVRVLADGGFPAGPSVLVWDGAGESGRAAASGVYFVRLEAAGRTLTKKMLLLR